MADVEHVEGTERAETAYSDDDAVVAGEVAAADERTRTYSNDALVAGAVAAAADKRPRTPLARVADAPWRLAAVAGILVALSTAVQLWFAPFLAGVLLGAVLRHRRARATAGIAVVATAAGWAVALGVRAILGDPVLSIARVTAGLAGLPAIGALALLATLLVAVVQGLAGVWLGRAFMPRG